MIVLQAGNANLKNLIALIVGLNRRFFSATGFYLQPKSTSASAICWPRYSAMMKRRRLAFRPSRLMIGVRKRQNCIWILRTITVFSGSVATQTTKRSRPLTASSPENIIRMSVSTRRLKTSSKKSLRPTKCFTTPTSVLNTNRCSRPASSGSVIRAGQGRCGPCWDGGSG